MLNVRCDEDWNKEIPAGIRIDVKDDEHFFILQIPYEMLNKDKKAVEQEIIRHLEMLYSGEYIFPGTGIYKKSHPERKVWEFIDKSKWTTKGEQNIENLYMALQRIVRDADKRDIQALYDGIDQHLHEVMQIIKHEL
jgi:hypothetical protein